MQQSSRGGPRPLVSPLLSPADSNTDSTFTVSKYGALGPPANTGDAPYGAQQSYSNGKPAQANGARGTAQNHDAAGARSVSQPSAEQQQMSENVARTHWQTFRRFLDSGTEPHHPRQNKAREKLTRLSRTQFQELSTDVYDEVQRRATRSQTGLNSLAPNPQFHPKRNQAREKLASLQTVRFKDLASDVFYEIERRFPNVAGGPSDPTIRSSTSSPPPRPAREGDVKPGAPPAAVANVRDLASNVFRQTAMIPNKSVMVEDEGDSDYESDLKSPKFDIDHMSVDSSDYGSRPATKIVSAPTTDSRNVPLPRDDGNHGLRSKIAELENALRSREENSTASRQMKSEMEDLLERNDKLEEELADLRAKKGSDDARGLAAENERLKEELSQQQRTTEEVRHQAEGFLAEMRNLSQRETTIYEESEGLRTQIRALESEVREWKERCHESKSELRQLKGTSQFFTPMPDFEDAKNKSFLGAKGLLRDVVAVKFQTSIDALLRTARADADNLLLAMRDVVAAIRLIERDLNDSDSPVLKDPRLGKLRQRLSSTSANLMIACKNHINGGALSPVSLLDAAASHVCSSVIEIAKICKLRTTSTGSNVVDPQRSRGSPGPESTAQRDDNSNYVTQRNGQDKRQGSAFVAADIPKDKGTSAKGPTVEVNDELRDFLENQTEDIVSSIQKLLSAIRADAKPQLLQNHMDDIVAIVTRVTSTMRDAFLSSLPLRNATGPIVEALEGCTGRIRAMADGQAQGVAAGVDGTGERQASKEFKQKLAGIAFDTAKQTKELSILLHRNAEEPEVDLT